MVVFAELCYSRLVRCKEIFKTCGPEGFQFTRARAAESAAAFVGNLGERASLKALGAEALVRDSTGGVYLVWNAVRGAPVVYSGSEGQLFVAAASEVDFLRLIPWGETLVQGLMRRAWESIANLNLPWSDPLDGPPKKEIDEVNLKAMEAEDFKLALAPYPKLYPQKKVDNFLAALEAAKITPTKQPAAEVHAASQTLLLRWIDTCEALRDGGPSRTLRHPVLSALADAPADYAREATYGVNDVFRHPKFGDGVVAKVVSPALIDVAFVMGRRNILHGIGDALSPYSTKAKYALNSAFFHPKFGDGVVTQVVTPQRIEVTFAGERVTLAHSLA